MSQKQRDQQLSEASLCHETTLSLCGATVTLQRTSSACRLRRNCPFHPTTDPHLACLLLAFPAPALPPSFRPWGERERRRKQEVSEEGKEGGEGGGEGGREGVRVGSDGPGAGGPGGGKEGGREGNREGGSE